MHNNFIRRFVAAGASVAVATLGMATLAPAAHAADVSLKFNCSASILNNQEFILDADITVPESVEVGQAVDANFSGTVTAPEAVRGAAYALLQGRFLEGTAEISGQFGGEAITLNADVPQAPIPSSGPGVVLPASGGGNWTASTVGAQDITIDGFVGALTMTKADNTAQSLQVTCTAKAPTTVVGTVDVVEATVVPEPEPEPEPTPDPEPEPVPTKKAGSKTTFKKVKHLKKKKRINVVAQVRSAGKPAAGKVRVVLKRGKKNVRVKKGVTLNKRGIVRTNFKKVNRKGKYRVVVQYQGNKTTKKSKKQSRVLRVR